MNNTSKNLYIGVMSGTSADGIDVALVDFATQTPRLVASHYVPYTETLKEKIHALCQPGQNEITRLGELDRILGKEFAKAVNDLLKKENLNASQIEAIGSHGQTIRHHPTLENAFTLQIGDPNTIAVETCITTIADFRRKDIALGGQGAPLVPTFHQAVFCDQAYDRAIVNIGGIANVTLLPSQTLLLGFDTGPGNTLIDHWILRHQQKTYDEHGAWSAQGKINETLLTLLLSDAYFHSAPPKSTGREYFNLTWLQTYLDQLNVTSDPLDVQTTLVELTARTIVDAIQSHLRQGEILICGGGVHNDFLLQRLKQLAQPHFSVQSTQQYHVDPDWVEAMAFAFLARQTLLQKTGNHPNVTGAKEATILGGIYY